MACQRRSELFCVDTKDGKTLWSKADCSDALPRPPPGAGQRAAKGKAAAAEDAAKRGYGSIVDAGSVLFALTPSSQLVVYEPSDKEFKQLASYKVADKATYAYPVVTGNRIYVKDADSVTLWTVE